MAPRAWSATRQTTSMFPSTQAQLTLVAKRVSSQPPTKSHRKINYLSGAVHSARTFTVKAGSGLDIEAEFQAPTARGTWPAFWLNGAHSWPPEIDIAEWKGLLHLETRNARTLYG